MGKTLIVCEKPSAGRIFAKHFRATERGKGYMEGPDFIVTWALGHLAELAMPDEYAGRGWDTRDPSVLPMIPDPWIIRAPKDADRRSQLETILKLAKRSDVAEVANACDPDREGEGIFRRIFSLADVKKPILRIWNKSMTDEDIERAWKKARDPERDFEALGRASIARAKADWLVGMNASRIESAKAHAARSIGRVRTPTLAFVVERDRERENFTSVPFWRVRVKTDKVTLASEKFPERALAAELAALAHPGSVRIDKVTRKPATQSPPKLFSTTTLEQAAARAFGLKPSATDAALQALYEAGLCTYPRTSSEHITAADEDDYARLLKKIAQIPAFAAAAAAAARDGLDAHRCVNDAKVEGHTAILPTEALDADAWAALTGDQAKIARLVLARAIVAASAPRKYIKCDVEAHVEGDEQKRPLAAHGTEDTLAGWKAVEALLKSDQAAKEDAEGDPDQAIPSDLKEGDVLASLSADVEEGTTKPPSAYTYATLLEAMKKAGRTIEDKALARALSGSDVHASGIGTDATRGRIIAELERLKYIRESKGSLTSTELGRAVVDSVAPELISAELSAQMEGRNAK